MASWTDKEFDFNTPMGSGHPTAYYSRSTDRRAHWTASADLALTQPQQGPQPTRATFANNGPVLPQYDLFSRDEQRAHALATSTRNGEPWAHSPERNFFPHVQYGYDHDQVPPSEHAYGPAHLPPMRTTFDTPEDDSYEHRIPSTPTANGSNFTTPSTSTRSWTRSPEHQQIYHSSNVQVVEPNPDLIRNARTPSPTDFSANAQIIRTAKSFTGIKYDFTWSQHHGVLYSSVVTARISELNTKLASGLLKKKMIRDMKPDTMAEQYKAMVLFAKVGNQRRINWMWCQEHIDLLQGLDLRLPDMGPEELDVLIKRTGAWRVDDPKKKGRGKKRTYVGGPA